MTIERFVFFVAAGIWNATTIEDKTTTVSARIGWDAVPVGKAIYLDF